jgi:hypothetical protein
MRRASSILRAVAIAAACVLGPSAATAAASAPPRASVTVSGRAATPPTSRAQGFLGISTGMTTIAALDGSAAHPDTPFINLVRSLSPGASPVLRLGGVGTDDSWWPIPGIKERYLYKLTPRWAGDVRAMLAAVGGKAILGVNLEENSKRIARTEVRHFERSIGAARIDAFELGNEPEFFPVRLPQGHPPHDYPYKIAHYGHEFSSIASALGGVPLAGPASGAPHWLSQLGTILRDLPSRLKLVTIHAYPMKHCSSISHLTVSDFFTRASIQGLAQAVRGSVRAAAAHGKPLRLDEMSGVSCGGQAGISNSFAEALWALNMLPALWHVGVQGVNFQTVNGGLNQMITARRSGSGWSASVQPVYYGLLAFADAAPAGSRLLRVSAPTANGLYQFAVRAPDGSERVVLTNVGAAARTVAVTASGVHGAGSVSFLRASSLSATSGATLGGRQISARTGRLTGTPQVTPVSPNATGAYAVTVPADAAAVLTIGG